MSGNDDNNEDEGAEGTERRFCWRWREIFVCDEDIGNGGDDEKVKEGRCEGAMDGVNMMEGVEREGERGEEARGWGYFLWRMVKQVCPKLVNRTQAHGAPRDYRERWMM